AVLRLDAVPPARRAELAARLAPLGFAPGEVARMRFDLSQVPPLGSPLLLEAWSEASDRRFRAFYEAAEGGPVTDAGWAYLKRKNGPFQPDLWFLARETLDQDPVGYAFCGLVARRVDGQYTLDAVGVARELRSDSAALRRLVISTLHELASFSPVGAVDAEVSRADGRLGDILRYVGFVPVVRSPVLVKRPESAAGSAPRHISRRGRPAAPARRASPPACGRASWRCTACSRPRRSPRWWGRRGCGGSRGRGSGRGCGGRSTGRRGRRAGRRSCG